MIHNLTVVAIELRSQPPLGDRHADRVPDSLSKRTRCFLNAGAALWMTWRHALPLTELLKVVD